MNELLFNLDNIRIEISFKSFSELRSLLSFYQKNNLYKINIPCKNSLRKDFLIDSIRISREEFPNLDIIPHFSILHEFKRNRINTLNSLIEFLQTVKKLGCKDVLLVSGSQKRSTLDSTSSLTFLKNNALFSNTNFSIGVAFNPYLPNSLFDEEIKKLEKKIQSGIVSSIWIQFGTNCMLCKSRIEILKNIILSVENDIQKKLNISLFGSILIPSKQFLSRFKYRPWKGVYCSSKFLESLEIANIMVMKLLKTYREYEIYPIIETDVSSHDKLDALESILQLSSVENV